jgi:hypothetical protein
MPLELAQIESADALWERLEELRRSDRAIAALQGSLSGFDHESTLLKVLALHPIDTSKTHVGVPLAREICEFLKRVDPEHCGLSLVDALAAVADRPAELHDGPGSHRFAHHRGQRRFPVLDTGRTRSRRSSAATWRAGRATAATRASHRPSRASRSRSS